jgi:hemerythrin
MPPSDAAGVHGVAFRGGLFSYRDTEAFMALIVWDARFETGLAALDGPHQSMVEILNRLHLAMKQGRGKAELGDILVFLKDYAATHFAMEEELMARHGYSRTAEHRAIHADLVRQVADLVTRFQAGSGMITLELMNFLEDWLVRHIQGEDSRFAQEFKAEVRG